MHAEPEAAEAHLTSVVWVGQHSRPEPLLRFQPQLRHSYKRNSSLLPAQPRPRGSTRAGLMLGTHTLSREASLSVSFPAGPGCKELVGLGRNVPVLMLPCKPRLRDAEGRDAPAECVGRAEPAPSCHAAAVPGSQGTSPGSGRERHSGKWLPSPRCCAARAAPRPAGSRDHAERRVRESNKNRSL